MLLTTRNFATVVSLLMISGLAGCDCGGDDGPGDRPDTGPTDEDGGGMDDAGPREDTGISVTCGNGTVEMMRGEVCDDGNDSDEDECLSNCQLACGDGVVNMVERCDTGIAMGDPGFCPVTDADCDDMDACTTDSVASGGTCTAECVRGTISTAMDGDGCCPTGENSTTDMDCPVMCNNGIVEAGETCDTAIAAGMPGECPTACDDGAVCTTDMLADGGTCTAACTTMDITMPVAGDGCCPMGATPMTDSDCMGCGDGSVGMGETCDTAIAAGAAGACPTACNDMMTCTRDALTGAGTCSAACTFTTITMPMAGDMCCPMGATIATDSDCMVRCGDGVTTAPGEECDDGNTRSGDGCSATCRREAMMTPTTFFRLTDLDIRDPHIFASVPLFGCQDLTDSAPLGMAGINPRIQTAVTTDGGDMDMFLDLTIGEAFRPLEQRAGMMTMSDITRPDCTTPEASTMCTLPAGATRTPASPVINLGMGMVCLDVLAGTVRPYTPAVVPPTAPAGGTCYSANIGDLTFTLSGIPITLRDTRVAGEYSGSPATQIVDGLLRGFLTEADANFTYIPDGLTGIGSIDCQPLSRVLRGGNPPPFMAGDPQPPAPCPMRAAGSDLPANCASGTDVDMGPGGARGWYFYLAFRARVVPYTEM